MNSRQDIPVLGVLVAWPLCAVAAVPVALFLLVFGIILVVGWLLKKAR